MANDLLTPTMITREAQRILHQDLNFIGATNRQYDKRFAQAGAKIGETLQIRLPNEYTVSDGATLVTQDTAETKVDLTVATQKHVGMTFSSEELSLHLDDFSERILKPAMSTLAASIEADAFSMYKDVYNQVGAAGTVPNSYKVLGQARAKLTDSLAPPSDRCMHLNTDAQVELTDALKGLFQSSDQIDRQYKSGLLGKTAGFGEIYENTLVPVHTNGTMGGTPLVAGASQTGSSLGIDGVSASGTFTHGTTFTLAGVYSVHPETKVSTGKLQQFVVSADVSADGAGAATLAIAPAIVTSGAKQTVTGSPADNAAVSFTGAANLSYAQNLAFHKDAFAFATADLEDMSKVGTWGAREVFDGLSMRLIRQYDINSDRLPCRIDILYGMKAIRPQLATRITA